MNYRRQYFRLKQTFDYYLNIRDSIAQDPVTVTPRRMPGTTAAPAPAPAAAAAAARRRRGEAPAAAAAAVEVEVGPAGARRARRARVVEAEEAAEVGVERVAAVEARAPEEEGKAREMIQYN